MPEQASQPAHTAVGRRPATLLVVVAVLFLVMAGLSWVKVDRVVFSPGPVYDTLGAIADTDVVQLDEELPEHDTEGKLYFTTIRLAGGPGDRLSLWEWLRAELDPARTVVPTEEVYPENVTAEEIREQNTELMDHSQQDAGVVALRAAGYDVEEDIVVAQVIKDEPADGVLEVDDQIIEVEGATVTDTESVRETLQAVPAGKEAAMVVLRAGAETELSVPTRDDDGRTIVGVYLAPRYETPYEITIDVGNVGGPSAGLMFSLAIYDRITPGALTKGVPIAGTGTISGNGTVGGIGGIEQKMIGADRAGAKLFLAPQGNCDEVAGNIPDGLAVVPVQDFDAATEVVQQAAGAWAEDEQADLSQLDFPSC